MATVFDSAAIAVKDRTAAAEAVLNTEVFPSVVRLDSDMPEPKTSADVWKLGSEISVVQTVSTGYSIERTPAQIRRAPSEAMTLGLVLNGTAAVRQGRYTWPVKSIHSGSIQKSPIHLIFGTEPFDLQIGSTNGTPSVVMSTYFDPNSLGLPIKIIEAAVLNLPASPLYSLFQDYLAALPLAASKAEGTPAAVMLGSATNELARAFFASASADHRLARESLTDVLVVQIDDFIDRHYDEAGLGAEQIAAEYHISVRHLYSLFAKRSQSLEQHIIHVRLEQARRQLVHAGSVRRPIEAIAFGCGFAHPQHFARRFRQAYGMSPRQWRSMHRPDMHSS